MIFHDFVLVLYNVMYVLQSMIPLILYSVYQIKNDNSSTYFNILKEKFIYLEVLTTQSDNSHARFQKRPLVEGEGRNKSVINIFHRGPHGAPSRSS